MTTDRYVMEVLGEDGDDAATEWTVELDDDLLEAIDHYLVNHPTWSRERLIREALQQQVYRS